MRRAEARAPTATSAGRNGAFLRSSLPKTKRGSFGAILWRLARLECVWLISIKVGENGCPWDPPLYFPETLNYVIPHKCTYIKIRAVPCREGVWERGVRFYRVYVPLQVVIWLFRLLFGSSLLISCKWLSVSLFGSSGWYLALHF
jgi:hypothetical protein